MEFIAILVPSKIEELAEACLRFTPDVSIGNDCLFLEVSRCKTLYSTPSLLRRLQAVADRFWVQVKIGVGPTLGDAYCAAKYGAKKGTELPLEALMDYATLLNQDPEVTRQTRFLIETLKKLGLKNLEDFKSFPVTSAFGAIAHLLKDRVVEGRFPPLPKLVLRPTIEEKEYFDRAETFDEVVFYLKTTLDRAMARMRGRGERATLISLTLFLENQRHLKKRTRTWEVSLPTPQGSTLSLLRMIRERLGNDLDRTPLSAPAIGAQFEILETVPSSGTQKDLFSKKEEQEEAWNTLLFRLMEKLGSHRTFVAQPTESYYPEKSWKRLLIQSLTDAERGTLTPICSPVAERPMRILKSPERVSFSPGRLFHSHKEWNVVSMEGPERIQSEWWHTPVERDYYRVATRSGDVLWVFKNHSAEYFLHGYFD